MSARKLPRDAFEQYVALGDERSYALLAQRLGVSKRAVVKRATKEGWAERLARIEQAARERTDERMADTMSEMNARHLATLKVMGARVVQALKTHPLDSGMEAMRAAEIVIKLERQIAGDASERNVIDVTEVTREEIQKLLTTAPISENGQGTNGEPGLDTGDDW